MGKRLYKMVLFFSLWMFLFGCATQQVAQSPGPAAFKPVDLNPVVRSGQYLQKVNNFLVILDASGTMKGAEFDMASNRPARVSDIRLTVEAPADLPADRWPALHAVVSHCTVHNSLAFPPSVAIDLT